jgi:hypothetical protein
MCYFSAIRYQKAVNLSPILKHGGYLLPIELDDAFKNGFFPLTCDSVHVVLFSANLNLRHDTIVSLPLPVQITISLSYKEHSF